MNPPVEVTRYADKLFTNPFAHGILDIEVYCTCPMIKVFVLVHRFES